jgi:hypothetical protein
MLHLRRVQEWQLDLAGHKVAERVLVARDRRLSYRADSYESECESLRLFDRCQIASLTAAPRKIRNISLDIDKVCDFVCVKTHGDAPPCSAMGSLISLWKCPPFPHTRGISGGVCVQYYQ